MLALLPLVLFVCFFSPPKKNASASRKAQAVARVVTVQLLKNSAFRQQKLLPKAKR